VKVIDIGAIRLATHDFLLTLHCKRTYTEPFPRRHHLFTKTERGHSLCGLYSLNYLIETEGLPVLRVLILLIINGKNWPVYNPV